MAVDLIGNQITYRYANDWTYEVNYEPDQITYRCIVGPAPGRVMSAPAHYAEVAAHVYMVAWYEHSGAAIATVVNLERGTVTGFTTLPHWIMRNVASLAGTPEAVAAAETRLRASEADYPRDIAFEIAQIVHVARPTAPEPALNTPV